MQHMVDCPYQEGFQYFQELDALPNNEASVESMQQGAQRLSSKKTFAEGWGGEQGCVGGLALSGMAPMFALGLFGW